MGRKPVAVALAWLRLVPAGGADLTLSQGVDDDVLIQVAVLTALNTAIKDLNPSIAEQIYTNPDGKIFRSFLHCGTINANQILAEWGDAREVFDHPDPIGTLAGVPPVTKAPSKQRGVSFRWACNKRLRVALATFTADIYQRARTSGKNHPHATRVLARAWIRIIWRCWQNRTPCNPAIHGGVRQPTEQPTVD